MTASHMWSALFEANPGANLWGVAAGAGIALLGALAAFRLMPGRREESVALPKAKVTVAAEAATA